MYLYIYPKCANKSYAKLSLCLDIFNVFSRICQNLKFEVIQIMVTFFYIFTDFQEHIIVTFSYFGSVFFFRENKKARESRFLPFFDFFHETLSGFHAHFLTLFHGHSNFFTDAILDIFKGGFSFSWTGYSEIVIIFTETIFSFHGYRKKINFTKFH